MSTYLKIKNGQSTKQYTLTDSYQKPYLKVSNSVLPLTENTTSGLQLKVKNGTKTYRAMEYAETSGSGTFYTTAVDSSGLSETTKCSETVTLTLSQPYYEEITSESLGTYTVSMVSTKYGSSLIRFAIPNVSTKFYTKAYSKLISDAPIYDVTFATTIETYTDDYGITYKNHFDFGVIAEFRNTSNTNIIYPVINSTYEPMCESILSKTHRRSRIYQQTTFTSYNRQEMELSWTATTRKKYYSGVSSSSSSYETWQ